MKILALDTSTRFLSIALMDGESVKAEYHEEAGIKHSEILIPTIKDMLEGTGWKISDIDLIAVGLGPGSFTGLRIAVSTVKALAASSSLKLKGVPTMDAMAENAIKGNTLVAPLLDAHKGKVYSAIYKRESDVLKRTTDYSLLTIDELLSSLKEKVLFFGDAIGKFKDELDACKNAEYSQDTDWYPKASVIGRLALERIGEGEDSPEEIDPLYLHAKECNITK